MRLKILLSLVIFCFVTVSTPITFAQTPTNTATINNLLAQIALLQAELAKIRGEVKETIKDGLKEGMTDPDIKKIQELLASDKKIYPEGKVDGYFDAKTKKAIKRFQKTHKLAVTGKIDRETKEVMLEYRKENAHKAPEGFLQAPGIKKKVEDRICEKATEKKWNNFCKEHDDALRKELDDLVGIGNEADSEIQVRVNNMRARAELIAQKADGLVDYSAVCTEASRFITDIDTINGTGEDYCHSTATTWVYAAQFRTAKNEYICVDSTGVSVLKVGILSSATGVSCETLNP